MSIELEPPIPTAEELQSYADRERLRLFGAYQDVYRLSEWLWAMIFAQAKEEFLRKEPWARQFIK
jgi:hypothetical protein